MSAVQPSFLCSDGTDGCGAVPSVLARSRTACRPRLSDGTVENTGDEIPFFHFNKRNEIGTNGRLACHICCDIIASRFHLQLVMKYGYEKEVKNPPASWTLTQIFNFLKFGPIDNFFIPR